ncbi:hypothetical protein BJ742DRAFT_138396 [Cladochytrium replicatum]|nr:hypothetical protein BJ742DRAFT_138396 [Cladochytrium replicatum]
MESTGGTELYGEMESGEELEPNEEMELHGGMELSMGLDLPRITGSNGGKGPRGPVGLPNMVAGWRGATSNGGGSRSKVARRRKLRTGRAVVQMPTKRGQPTTNYKIDEAHAEAMEQGVDALMKSLYLTRSEKPVGYFGSRPLEDASNYNYTTHLLGLRYFCALIGDYRSLLLNQYPPKERIPSMCARIIALFIRYKHFPKALCYMTVFCKE